jgi:hypothetical protein
LACLRRQPRPARWNRQNHGRYRPPSRHTVPREYNEHRPLSPNEEIMYHYDAKTALEELQEDALLPHPVKLRDMILRIQLGPQDAQLMNSEFQDYLTRFGELQRVARGILEKLAAGKAKN